MIARCFKHVSFTHLTRHRHCNKCCEYQIEIRKVRNGKERLLLKAKMVQHHILHKAERRALHSRVMEAQQNPDFILQMAIDCPSGYLLPHMYPVNKKLDKISKLEVDCVGALDDTHSRMTYFFFGKDEFPKDPNLIMTVLWTKIVIVIRRTRKHPGLLRLQFDNCWKENKNRYVLALCCFLVMMGIFSQVEISFLPQGHTHEKIDQIFSVFARALEFQNVSSLPELMDACRDSYSGRN